MSELKSQMKTNRHQLSQTIGITIGAFMLCAASTQAEQLKPFPKHWGKPPAAQTRDYVEWPDGYGHGSSTVGNWITANLEKEKAGGGSEGAVLFSNDFSAVPTGKLPDDFLVLNGAFTVQEENGEKFMELPGAPLESFGVMFGPAGVDNVAVSAKVFGTAKGRRYPEIALGLNGLGGYRLKLAPAKRSLQLFRGPEEGGELVASTDFAWTSGSWTHLTLCVRRMGEDNWRVEGKAWMEGGAEPSDWMVTYPETQKPLAGRPYVTASPYSGTPIRFDDLVVHKLEP